MSSLAKANTNVDITKVAPQQLQELAQAIEEEIKQLTMHYQQLAQATQKFKESKKVLNYLESKSEKKDVMVPLTSSLYVPGTLDEDKKMLLEVGAGYFVEKDIPGAKDYCDRKAKTLQENT